MLHEEKALVNSCLHGGGTKHESHDRFDYLSVSLPDNKKLMAPTTRLSAFLKEQVLVLITNGGRELDKVVRGKYCGGNAAALVLDIFYTFVLTG